MNYHSENAKMRWKNISKEDRSKQMSSLGKKGAKARWAKMSKKQRRENAIYIRSFGKV